VTCSRSIPVAAQEFLTTITTRVTPINCRHDRVVPLANAEFLDEQLPNSRSRSSTPATTSGKRAPAEYAAIVLDSTTHRSRLQAFSALQATGNMTRRVCPWLG
jgi:hypothetical protein